MKNKDYKLSYRIFQLWSCLILTPQFANGAFITVLNPDSLVKKDTSIVIQKLDYELIQNYQQILEKTNEQLNLWWNPYGVLIAILSILFTILTIIFAFVIYRQSKESKDLIKKSLDDHKSTLDKLISEKNTQIKLMETNLNNMISDYTERLKTSEKENKKEIEEFIKDLEKQKEYFDKEKNSFKHIGWNPQDIKEDYSISNTTNFYAEIKLSNIHQRFQIYLRILASDNKIYWIGFGGGDKNEIYSSINEYSRIQLYNSKQITIQENIFSTFSIGFPSSKVIPKHVNCIRLRSSDMDLTEVQFTYTFN